MEQQVLARLKVLLESGGIEIAAYFRTCALLGVSFAAALAVASQTTAFAQSTRTSASSPSSYADVLSPDVLEYIARTAGQPATEADPFDDHYFVQKSGEPFHKFDKAPDF